MEVKISSRKICVFTGSRHGQLAQYADAAGQLGRQMVARGYGLVYGGGNVGLMTAIADTVLERKDFYKGWANR